MNPISTRQALWGFPWIAKVAYLFLVFVSERFVFSWTTEYADHSDCIDLRLVVQPAWGVFDLTEYVTAMHPSDPCYSVPPFPAFPSTSRYVPLGSVEEAMGRVCRSIDAREAISLVIGPPGTGKTLICGLLEEHYRESHEVVILGESPLANRVSLLRHILHHLGVNMHRVADSDLELALLDHVNSASTNQGGLLLLIDEAQSLSAEVLEAVRSVTNIMRSGEPRVVAVMVGDVKMDELLVDTSMEAFRQRVATRCYLHPLNVEETQRYVFETIRSCGAEPEETITFEAIAAVHHACSGVPRLVNQLLTQAIDCAEEAEQGQIDEKVVDVAWAQLQQLPSPMLDEPKIELQSSAIEFGELDESSECDAWPGESEPELDRVEMESEEEPIVSFIAPYSSESSSVSTETSDRQEETESSHEQSDAHEIVIELKAGDIFEDAFEGAVPDCQSAQCVVDSRKSEPPSAWGNNEATKSSNELFGDFDEEQEIEVGSAFADAVKFESTDAITNLEDILQHQIIGINAFSEMAEGQTGITESSGEELVAQRESLETPASFEQVTEDTTMESPTYATPKTDIPDGEQAVAELTPLRLAIADDARCSADVVDGDDTDMLVIEEEVELRRIDRPKNVVDPKPVLTIDYQQMLARMRSGS